MEETALVDKQLEAISALRPDHSDGLDALRRLARRLSGEARAVPAHAVCPWIYRGMA